jgi:ParB family protein of integrating conjugative element (PFGI_1 class)
MTPPNLPQQASDWPLTAPVLELPLAAIRPYIARPRQRPNPAYERLKVSIRTHGLLQPLVVTHLPNQPHFTLYAGGNTRLAILQALWDETGDARFARVDCHYRAYTDAFTLRMAHLVSHEIQGRTLFIDRAMSLDALWQTLRPAERAAAAAATTDADCIALLARHGFDLSLATFKAMRYAVYRLAPLLPQALAAGLTERDVTAICRLERSMETIWHEQVPNDRAAFTSVFATLCRRHDHVDWDLADLRQALEAEIVDRAGVSLQVVRLAWQCLVDS